MRRAAFLKVVSASDPRAASTSALVSAPGMFAFCCPRPYGRAAPCPVPVASNDSELIPELSSPSMLTRMTEGCDGATGIIVIDTRPGVILISLLRPPVAVLPVAH